MNTWKQCGLLTLLLVILLFNISFAAAPSNVKDIVAAAAKEGGLDFYAPTQVGERGARRLNAAFNRKHSLAVTFKFSPSANMDKDLAGIITQVATGGATTSMSPCSRIPIIRPYGCENSTLLSTTASLASIPR